MKLSNSQVSALSLMKSGKNVYLTGKGGSGKSTLVEIFTKERDNYAIVAPTGTAAINVKGSTIHQLFGLVPHYKDPLDYYHRFKREIKIGEDEKILKIASVLETLEILIIDEVGMVRSDVFGAMDLILRAVKDQDDVPFGGVQVIAVGDLYQIPPVVTSDERRFFPQDDEWFFRSPGFIFGDFEKIELTEVHRQGAGEERFVDALNSVRSGDFVREHIDYLNERITSTAPNDSLILCARRKQVNEINQKKLDELKGKFVSFDGDIFGDQDLISQLPVSSKIWLKPGAKVMFVTNNPKKGWFNGSTGVFLGKRGASIAVRVGDKVVTVDKHEFELKKYTKNSEGKLSLETVASLKQFPIQLAWAITIHKSQGKSLNKVHLDLGHSGAFDHGQLYVGLSRCKSYEGLTLAHKIQQKDVQCKQIVKDFMSEAIIKDSEENIRLEKVS